MTAHPRLGVRSLTVGMALLAFAAGACRHDAAPPIALHEVAGSRPQRVAAITRTLFGDRQPPSPILDARYAEERIGDDVLGPSDLRTYCVLEIDPAQLPLWTGVLTPAPGHSSYARPDKPLSWWVSRGDFDRLGIYRSDVFTGRDNGWVGVDGLHGRIYLFSYST